MSRATKAVDMANSQSERIIPSRVTRGNRSVLAYLWLAVTVGAVGDTLTTVHGIAIGLPEGNPLVHALFPEFGALSLVALKLPLFAWCLIVQRYMARRYAIAALSGLAFLWIAATVANTLSIAARSGIAITF